MCDNSIGCEEMGSDDYFATEAVTMIDVLYEGYLDQIKF